MVYDSVGQPKASKPEVPVSTAGGSCFSIVFIANLINYISNYYRIFINQNARRNVTILIVLSGTPRCYL